MVDHAIPLRARYYVHERDDWAYEAEDDADFEQGYPNATGIRILDLDELVALVKEWPDHGDIEISSTRPDPIDSTGFQLYLLPEPARRLGLALVHAADLIETGSDAVLRGPETAAAGVAEESTGASAARAAADSGGSQP